MKKFSKKIGLQFSSKTNFGATKFWPQKILIEKIKVKKKILVYENLGQKKIKSKKVMLKVILVKKIGNKNLMKKLVNKFWSNESIQKNCQKNFGPKKIFRQKEICIYLDSPSPRQRVKSPVGFWKGSNP